MDIPGIKAVLFVVASALAFVLVPRPVQAAADDASHWIVVPFVAVGAGASTRVTISNHGTLPMEPLVTFLDADRGAATPAQFRCAIAGGRIILPLSDATLDVATDCRLGSRVTVGALHVRSRQVAAGYPVMLERLSATAVVAYANAGGAIEQEVAIDGVPMAGFPGNTRTVVVDGLRHGPDLGTECSVVTGLDGSRAGGLVGSIRLRDEQGQPLGRDIPFAARPYSVRVIDDLFGRAGVGALVLGGVRAEFALQGGNDQALVNCRVRRDRGMQAAPGMSYHLALDREPASAARARSVSAVGDPARARFSVTGTESNAHIFFVRHPDRLRCGAKAVDAAQSALLRVALHDPDFDFVADTDSLTTGTIDVGNTKGAVGRSGQGAPAGVSQAWALHVEQLPPGDPATTIEYTVHCESGNGTTPLDYMFPFRTRP